MTFKKYTYPTHLLYSELEVLTVRKLFIKHAIITQHKIQPVSTTKRRIDIVYKIPQLKTIFAQKFINYLGPKLYNAICRKIMLKDFTSNKLKTQLIKYLNALNYNETEDLLIKII